MTPAAAIDRAWIRAHGRLQLALHANMQECHVIAQVLVDVRTGQELGLTLHRTSWKKHKRLGDRAGTTERHFTVRGHKGAIDTLDEALEILRIVRGGEQLEALHG